MDLINNTVECDRKFEIQYGDREAEKKLNKS